MRAELKNKSNTVQLRWCQKNEIWVGLLHHGTITKQYAWIKKLIGKFHLYLLDINTTTYFYEHKFIIMKNFFTNIYVSRTSNFKHECKYILVPKLEFTQ